jgi:Ca2+-transporting ATPase
VAGVAVRPDWLTSEEAARRLAADGPNELPTAKARGPLAQARAVLREPMLFLLLAAGSVNFLLSEPLDGAILMATVVVVIAISVYESQKTEAALAALRDLSSPRALVVRDGIEQRIAGREVVRGDLLVLAEGDRVAADAVIVEGQNVAVDESALTGESVPVRKSVATSSSDVSMGEPGGDGTPWIFSGTLVVKGQALALVKESGSGTQLGRIGAALESIDPARTRLQQEIDRIVRVVAVLGLGAAAVIAIVFAQTRHDWLEGLLAGIATAMSMLPEEFPVVLTIFLALGAWRMSRHNVLARRSAVIETLGTATVICVDKTGTLTMNTMTIRSIRPEGESLDVVRYGALASPERSCDPTDRAFIDRAKRELTDDLDGPWRLVRAYALSETRLAVIQAMLPADGSRLVVAAKGAPEAISELCGFDGAQRAAMLDEVERMTRAGQRVIAVARAESPTDRPLPDDPGELRFGYLGLAGLQDPLRPGAPAAVALCRRAGIRVIMITGDYPGTAAAIAAEVGLDHSRIVTGEQLRAMSDDELADAVRTADVFARTVPDQKLRLVRALQANGEVVGMTGDGVNDAPALRAADIGIAMGDRGTDVAREASALVIVDDDIASIAHGIRQGRAIFDNLRKAMAYLVAVHVTIFGTSLLPVFVPGWPLVLLPLQIALLELVIDPACSVVFESEQPDPSVMDRAPRRVGAPILSRHGLTIALTQGVSVLAAVLAVYLWAVLGDRSDTAVRSVTFTTLFVGNLALILVNRSWHLTIWRALRDRRNTTVKWIILGASGAVVALLNVPPLREAFHFGPMRLSDWLVAVGAGFTGIAWFEIYKLRSGDGRNVHVSATRSS